MIDGTLGVLWVLFILLVGLCVIGLFGRVHDHFMRRRWDRRRERRVIATGSWFR